MANLSGADLSEAGLIESELCSAKLSGANLRAACLFGAVLTGADLRRAELNEAILGMANLSGADLSGADLSEADLYGANLESTDLTDCCTDAMSVRSVDFTNNVKLTQEQVNAFFGVKSGVGLTFLPGYLSYPDHWYNAESMTESDIEIADEEYMLAWITWQRSR